MIASRITPVVAAYTAQAIASAGDGFALSLLVLADGRVVSLDPSDHDTVYPSMEVFGADARALRWEIGELVPDPETLQRYADGYEIDADPRALAEALLDADARVVRAAFRHGAVAWGVRPACHRRLEAVGIVRRGRDTETGAPLAYLTETGDAVAAVLAEWAVRRG